MTTIRKDWEGLCGNAGNLRGQGFFLPAPINAVNHLQHLHIGENHGISLEFADDAGKTDRIQSFSGSGEKKTR